MKIKLGLLPVIIAIIYFLFNVWLVYDFSNEYSEQTSDVAIILGAGTHDGKVSPVFKERLNHGTYLIQKGIVKKIIVTGGYGKGEIISDSHAGRSYLREIGLDSVQILIEEQSTITLENVMEARNIMNQYTLGSALIVSDPLHMKRAMRLVHSQNIHGEPSPTQTSAYKSWLPKLQSILYEAFFLSISQ